MRTCLVVFISIFLPVIAFAQKAISGKVLDNLNEPIIGASVLEKGTTNGTITDIDGNFNLTVSENAVLAISYIGYASQEIAVSGRTDFKIILKEDSEQLDEVVVVGYGVQKKSSMTASVASVSAKDIA